MSSKLFAIACATTVLSLVSPANGVVVYVDDNARVGGNGQSWATAFKYLTTALSAAAVPQNGIDEIRVAQGVYRPDESPSAPNGTGNRLTSFNLVNGINLMGGFAGIGSRDPDARDANAYPTRLSGDLLGNDQPGFINYADNSYRIVSGVNVSDVLLEGFVIKACNRSEIVGSPAGGALRAMGAEILVRDCVFTLNWGGGSTTAGLNNSIVVFEQCSINGNLSFGVGQLYLVNSSTTFLQCEITGNISTNDCGVMTTEFGDEVIMHECTVKDNFADDGGGVFHLLFGPLNLTVTDTLFENNGASTGGVASIVDNSTQNVQVLTFERCLFDHNFGEVNSGALTILGVEQLTLRDCDFIDNKAIKQDTGVLRFFGHLHMCTISRCRFIFNRASSDAGVIKCTGQLRIDNSLFVGNVAERKDAGAIYVSISNPTIREIRNCTFVENHAGGMGGALFCQNVPVNCGNSIFWDNTAGVGDLQTQQIKSFTVLPTISHCCIQGWTGSLGGSGNFAANPIFQDPSGSDGNAGTSDDDLRLTLFSPCVDEGDNDLLPNGSVTDLNGDLRVVDGTADGMASVDLGCFELGVLSSTLDFKPADCPNPFNQSSQGKIPVAFAGASTLDVTQIDLSSLKLSRADGVGGLVIPIFGPPGPHPTFSTAIGLSLLPCECDALGRDEYLDLQLKFSAPAMTAALMLSDLRAGETVQLRLSGAMINGTPILGLDCIYIEGP